MRRSPERLANERFDLLVIGGGITGACIARDASLRGLKVALVEKNDFANATSAHNSKLIHGGLRYLRNFEIGLVRESLRERRIWQRIAPHLVRPLPFLLPMRNGGFKQRATLSAGLTLYDLLSFDRTWLDDPAQRLAGHKWFGRKAALDQEPVLDAPDLEGAFLYYDAQMYAPERLALECLLDADAHGAALANYVEAETLLIRNSVVEGAKVHDVFSESAFDVRAKLTIVAAGPWADLFLDRSLGKIGHRLLRSKGVHLIVPRLTRKHALTVAVGGGHFFILPWRGHTLIGTTDTEFDAPPDSVAVSEKDIEGLLSLVNDNLPAAHIRRENVEHAYAGLRPLVDDGSGDTYDASRRAELIDHAKEDGVRGLFSAFGGKWTTSRGLAEIIVDAAVKRLGLTAQPCKTAMAAVPGGTIDRIETFVFHQRAAHKGLSSIDHLTAMYGARLDTMLAPSQTQPDLLSLLGQTGDIEAQVPFAIQSEMAMTLADVVLRRTGIGQLGLPPSAILERIARMMATELNWNNDRTLAEIASVKHTYVVADAS